MLLSVPPPETIDHAPVVALPPILAPVKVSAEGDAEVQTLSGPPDVTVGAVATDTVTVPGIWAVQPVVAFVANTL